MSNKESTAAEVMNQAVENYFTALKTGVKVQEDVSAWLQNQIKKTASFDGFKEPVQKSINEAIKKMQAGYDEALELMEKNSAQSLAMMSKVMDLSHASNPEEARDSLQKIWDTSLDAVRKNAQMMVDANARVMEAYADFVQVNTKKATAQAAV